MTEYTGTLVYEVKKTHPDYELIEHKDGTHEYEDIYKFDQGGYSEDYIRDYILNDLMLVAGGGYSTSHVKVLFFKVVNMNTLEDMTTMLVKYRLRQTKQNEKGE